MMGHILHVPPILRSNQPIVRDPDRDKGGAIFSSAPFRSRDRASTNHFGGTFYTDLFREEQSHFERGTGLSPALALEQHP